MGDSDEVAQAVARFEAAGQALGEHRLDAAVEAAVDAAERFVAIDGAPSPDAANALLLAVDALQARSGPGDLDAAERHGERSLHLLEGLAGDGGAAIDSIRLRALRAIGTTARLQARYEVARAAFDAALGHAEAAFGTASAEVGHVCNDLGVLGKFTAAFDDAQRWYERALAIVEATEGSRSAAAATLHHNLAGLAHSRQRSAEGVDHGRRSVEIRCELLGEHHLDVALDRANLGGLLMDLGDVEEAEACFQAARATFERVLSAEHLEVAIAWHNLAAVADARGATVEAEQRYRRALAIKERALGTEHPSTLITVVNLAHVVADADEAVGLLRRAVDGLTGVVGDDDRTLAAARQGLADRGG